MEVVSYSSPVVNSKAIAFKGSVKFQVLENTALHSIYVSRDRSDSVNYAEVYLSSFTLGLRREICVPNITILAWHTNFVS